MLKIPTYVTMLGANFKLRRMSNPASTQSGGGSPANKAVSVPSHVGGWLALWIFLALLLCAILPLASEWIELFNGATFPSVLGAWAAKDASRIERFGFALVLSMRTLINLGGLAVLVGTVWIFLNRRNAKMQTIEQVKSVQLAAIQLFVANVLLNHKGQRVDDPMVARVREELAAYAESEAASSLTEEIVKIARR